MLRLATRKDIPAMHRVRLAVRENRLTISSVTEEHYFPAIEATGRGWVIDEDGEVVAFAVGNAETGNIWALFVYPDREGRGHGRALQRVMVGRLFEQGLTRLFLTTEPGTRAQRSATRSTSATPPAQTSGGADRSWRNQEMRLGAATCTVPSPQLRYGRSAEHFIGGATQRRRSPLDSQ